MTEEIKEKPIFVQLFNFYFSNSWYSFFTISYLLFFLYSALFYFDNVILAIKFLFYTFGLSTPLLELNYLFWGVIFIISLIIPFSVSIYALFILHNLWEKTNLQRKQKFVTTIFVLIVTIIIIISMDDIIRIVAKQNPLTDFVQRNELLHRLVQ